MVPDSFVVGVEGVRVGHWTEPDAATGCTVVVLPEGTVASGEVRGGAPATREFALLDPVRTVDRVDAVVLSGGSTFGLAACDGVVHELESRGRGFETPAGPVPIVVGLSLFDLTRGDGRVRPGAEDGRTAAVRALESSPGEAVPLGRVGAGTGCSVGFWFDEEEPGDGALVGASLRTGDLVVAALVACNAVGRPDAGGAIADRLDDLLTGANPLAGTNTVIGLVVTNARLDKTGCLIASQGAHDGLARSVVPPHGLADGDAFVAAATGVVEADRDVVRLLAAGAVEAAIRTLLPDQGDRPAG